MLEEQVLRDQRSSPNTSNLLNNQSPKVSFGQASFDSSYGSDVDNSDTFRHWNASQQASTSTASFSLPERRTSNDINDEEETRQKFELTLGLFFSGKPQRSTREEVESEEEEEQQQQPLFASKRPRLADDLNSDNILDLLIGSLSDSQTDQLFRNTGNGKFSLAK